jgi:hypothetical protein
MRMRAMPKKQGKQRQALKKDKNRSASIHQTYDWHPQGAIRWKARMGRGLSFQGKPHLLGPNVQNRVQAPLGSTIHRGYTFLA